MRYVETHKVNTANDIIDIQVLDEPGSGGANHFYNECGFATDDNPSVAEIRRKDFDIDLPIVFQNGPINEVGVNGITHEVLIAILIDRLQAFQSGPFKNDYNQVALEHLLGAQSALQQRTRDRMNRGVEGTLQK